MPSPLLETKLHLPTHHGRLVPRARLSELIARATSAPLTLVSAPAGFGKSTVMAELASLAGDAHVAWVSLDPGDDDPVTFWTYVIEALDRAAPGLGKGARSILAGGQGTVDAALATLLNGIAGLPEDLVLVLDDLHTVESPPIHEQLGYLLDHLPARGHVVIGTRADPPIPLSRLRARGGLVEIRASDLRFSTAEAASYLGAMGLALTPDDIVTLETRTEGWIAALQLAALSLQGRSDATGFIAAFAGEDRFIVDYLVEEVLRRQPTGVRDFLLKTSILSRVTGPLADAVTGREGGARTIEALDRANLFVVALDDQRRWYRYHHLFGGVLQAYVAAEQSSELPVLHRRASEWFEAHGDHGEAIEHALQAGDDERAADLVEVAMTELSRLRREPTLRRWLDAIPRDVVARRPALAVAYAGTILSTNEVAGVEELLDGADALLSEAAIGSVTRPSAVADQADLGQLRTMIELYRAAVAKVHGDLEGNLTHARRVLEMVGESDHMVRGGAAAFLGLAYWGMGDLEAGDRWYTEGMASLEKAGRTADLVGGAIVRGDMRLAVGRLGDVMRVYEEGLELGTRTQPPLRGVTDMHTGLADVAYQRGRLDEAMAHLDAGRRSGEEFAFPRDAYRSRIVRARILQAEGDVDGAVALLEEAERLYVSDFSPDVRPVSAIRARVLIAHGRPGEARAWARRAGVSVTDDITYVDEFSLTTFARLLVAEASEGDAVGLAPALQLLDRLLMAAQQGHRDGSRLEILVVRALARHAAGDPAGAVDDLDAAIALAEPEGYVRVFLDEGAAMTRLSKVAAKRASVAGYVYELLRAAGPDGGRATPQHGLVEPLSERELEVLRLLRSDLDGPEMAAELFVSLNTLRTHTKSIYAKLGVGSRRAALRRASELGLL